MSESSTSISKFYEPPDSDHKFHKTRIENWLSIGFELGFPWQRTYCYNHYTMFNTQDDREGVLNFYISISKVLEQSWRAFTSLKLCKCSQNPHPVYRQHQTPTKTNHHLLNHLQTLHTHTKLHHPAHCCVGLRGRNSRNKKWNLSTS